MMHTSLAKPLQNKLSINSLLVMAGLGLVALTGCQTTTGISNTNSQSTIEHQRIETQQPVINDTQQRQNQDVPRVSIEPQEDVQPQNNRVDNPFESDQTRPSTSHSSHDNSVHNNNTQTPTDSRANDSGSQSPNTVQPTRPRRPVSPPVRIEDNRSVNQILLEQARQNSSPSAQASSSGEDGDNLPAFRSLMDKGVSQLRQGQTSAAQDTFTRAQRIAPKSSAVYFYLGQVALKQDQPLKAEAMARRGLVVAKASSRKTALWQVILKAGQAQGNQRVINEARRTLSN